MLARLITRHARKIVVAGLLLTVLVGVVGAGAVDALSLNRFEAPGSESLRARAALARDHGTGAPNVALLVTARQGTVDDPSVAAAGRDLTRTLAARPGVGDAWSYWTRGTPDTLRSADARHALVLAWLPGDADRVRRDLLPDLAADLDRDTDVITVQVGGGDEVFRTVMEQARGDFVRAELIILPAVLALLWAFYRRWSAALVTLGVGIFAVLGSLALLRLVVAFTEISTFAANIALVMGIGLGVDYGLFVIYRFREELHQTTPPPHANKPQAPTTLVVDAVARTVSGAGRTVLFSGLTVAASLVALLAFPFPFLASFAYAGVAVVLAALLGATVLLPAALVLLGHRVDRPTHPPAIANLWSRTATRAAHRPTPTHPPATPDFWFRTATRVVRRPITFGTIALGAVLLLAAPLLGVRFGVPDDRVLPSSAPVRQMYDTIRAEFVAEEADAVQVVAPGGTPAQVGPYAERLSRLDGVLRVDSATGTYTEGSRVGTGDPRFTSPAGTWLSVVVSTEQLNADPTGTVDTIRNTPTPFGSVLVGGYPAELTDYRDGVTDRLPLVLALVVGATFLVLFLMTGSVVAPIKASLLNLLSLGVMFGVLVLIFQNGNLSALLGFTPTGSIEPSIPILMFCVAYGLSMDYEVFLLSRIKEEYDRTGDATGSIPLGIARSAPLVTAAAVILSVSFAVYATGQVVFLKQLGIGMAVAILVDATLIRTVLAPAAMRLTGRANWWAPRPLRRLHNKIGLTEPPPPAHPDTAHPLEPTTIP